MKNKIEVTIGGKIYRLVAEEDVEYTKMVADYVDGKITELMRGGDLSDSDAYTLAALNIADDYFKELKKAESLRGQLKDYIEDAARAKSELAEVRREMSRTKKITD